MLARFIVFLCLSLGATLASAATVVVFGDSLSAGYGLKPGEGWVELLRRDLGPGHKVVNASLSGETSAGGITRLPAVLAQHKPDVLILELGGNDGLRGLPVDELRRNLNRMVALGRQAGARPLLVGIELPPNYGRDYTAGFKAVYTELARREKVPLVASLVAGFEARRVWFQPDGIHPAAVAQPAMLANVKVKLLPLLGTAKMAETGR